jgi:hypothetical protein
MIFLFLLTPRDEFLVAERLQRSGIDLQSIKQMKRDVAQRRYYILAESGDRF